MIVSGAGLGFRRDISSDLLELDSPLPRFIELAPENWMDVGGRWGRVLDAALERYPLTCHGLSLSVGSPEPLDRAFLADLKRFFERARPALYSEHLSYSKCDNAHLHDLLPIPFRWDAVTHVASRIRQVQEILERRIAIENVSYYAAAAPEMSEAEFVGAVIRESGCDLLLDVNNVFVNAHNHGYDAERFIDQLPLERVACVHIAGHEKRSEDLIIDTHGRPVVDPVFELLEYALPKLRPVPILLERDYNFPGVQDLIGELERVQAIADRAWEQAHAA